MKWLKKIFGDHRQEPFVDRLRRDFEFLESEFSYLCDRVQDPVTGEDHDGFYLVTYINSAIHRSIQIAAPAAMKKSITIILYCDTEPEKVTVRDTEKYLPVRQLRAFYAPDKYNSSDYIGQIADLDRVIQNYKTALLESRGLVNGSTWVDRAEFDRKLFETGKFRYSSSTEMFTFIDQSRFAFEFLVEELGYREVFATDRMPPYNTNEPCKYIAFGNKERNSYISVEYDLREEHFGIKLYDFENGLERNLEYELFNPLDMKNQQDFNFLKEVAQKLRKRINQLT